MVVFGFGFDRWHKMAAGPRLKEINIADRHLLIAQRRSEEGWWSTFSTNVK